MESNAYSKFTYTQQGLPLLLDRDRVANVDQHRVEGLGHFKSLIDGVIHEVLSLHADDAVVLSLFQQEDSVVAHGGSVYAVAQSGRAAALDIPRIKSREALSQLLLALEDEYGLTITITESDERSTCNGK